MTTNIFEQIQQFALQTLTIEATAIESLKKNINNDFVQCVLQILACKGRIVLTGIGKSAIIAQKITATFNSTGTPALFMHAADAIHGDLGMIQPHDLVLCISKSGETPEIKVLIPLLKNKGNLLIALVGNIQSHLAQKANFVLNTTVEREACPHNLAPTASTSAQLAMGDALAMSVLQMRGFSSQDFASFHPGGTLGKKLYLRVKDLLIKNTNPIVYLKSSIQQLIVTISSNRLGATAVLHPESKTLSGIITDGDLRRVLQNYPLPQLAALTAADIMTTNPKTIAYNALAVEALQMMETYKVTQIIVLKDQQCVGMIHIHNLIQEGLL